MEPQLQAPVCLEVVGHRRNKLPSQLEAKLARLEISRLPIQDGAQNDKATAYHHQRPSIPPIFFIVIWHNPASYRFNIAVSIY